MSKLNILLYIFLFNYYIIYAFDNYDGYYGCKHKLSLGFDFHPLPTTLFVKNSYWNSAYSNPDANGLVLPLRFDNPPPTGDDYIEVPRFKLKAVDLVSYSLNYEFFLNDFSSLGVDFLFRSSRLMAEHNNSSWLYPEYSIDEIDFANVSGIDVRLKFRHYMCKYSGKMAPFGIYFDYIFNLPFTRTKYIYYQNNIKEYSNGFGGGFGIGKQGFFLNKVSYDFGVSTIFNTMIKENSKYLVNDVSKDFEGNLYSIESLQEPLKKPGVYQNNNSNYFALYFKIGYLIF
jgi:hypothetical protein